MRTSAADGPRGGRNILKGNAAHYTVYAVPLRLTSSYRHARAGARSCSVEAARWPEVQVGRRSAWRDARGMRVCGGGGCCASMDACMCVSRSRRVMRGGRSSRRTRRTRVALKALATPTISLTNGAARLPTTPRSSIYLAYTYSCFSSPPLTFAYHRLHLFRPSGPDRHAQGCQARLLRCCKRSRPRSLLDMVRAISVHRNIQPDSSSPGTNASNRSPASWATNIRSSRLSSKPGPTSRSKELTSASLRSLAAHQPLPRCHLHPAEHTVRNPMTNPHQRTQSPRTSRGGPSGPR